MRCAFDDGNTLTTPIRLIRSIEASDISITLLFKGGEVERDVVWCGEAVFFAVA